MKMRWYDRVLIALGGAVLMASGVLVILAGLGFVELPAMLAFASWLPGINWQWMTVLFIAGILCILWGFRLLIWPVAGMRADRGGKYYTVKTNDGDGVYISVQALDHLIHRCLSQWPEILSTQVRIGGREAAMQITLRVTLASGANIPGLLSEVRGRIRSYIEECSGVTVENVRVIVETTKEGSAAKEKEAKLLPGAEVAPETKAEPEPEPDGRVFSYFPDPFVASEPAEAQREDETPEEDNSEKPIEEGKTDAWE